MEKQFHLYQTHVQARVLFNMGQYLYGGIYLGNTLNSPNYSITVQRFFHLIYLSVVEINNNPGYDNKGLNPNRGAF